MRTPLLAFLVPWLIAALPAQETKSTDATLLAPKLALVQQALRGMATLPSCAFATTMRFNSPFARVAVARAGGPPQAPAATATGAWGEGRLHASFTDGADEVVFVGRAMLARTKGGAWVRRQGRLAEGGTLPHVFDPDAFFAALLDAELLILHAEVGTLDDRPVEIVTARVEGEPARDLVWAGVVPDDYDIGRVVLLRVGGGAVAAKGEAEIDLAFFVDPATRRLLKVRLASYTKGAAGAGVIIGARGGAPAEVAAAEEEEEAAATGADQQRLRLRDGLPIRSKRLEEGWTTTGYDVVFKEHGTAKVPELDAMARARLGLGEGR